jgi:histidinol-phosphate aminotransferase
MNIEFNSLVRKNILGLKPYSSARGDFLDGMLMDANENSFGSVIDAFDALALNRYPDPSHRTVREKLGRYLTVPVENLFIGVGSDEIIDLVVRIFCEPAIDSVMILDPTYGMYKVVCDINNVKAISVPLDGNYQIDIKKVEASLEANTKIIFICSPNNPTANIIKKESILELARRTNCIIVVDEAYIDFAEEFSLTNDAAQLPNIVVLRTFSKIWGLAGVRCGYCITSEKIISLLYKIKAPYNMNKLTSAVILKALDNVKKKDELKDKLLEQRKFLLAELSKVKGVIKVLPSQANFILFEVKEPKDVYRKLTTKGIIIRDRSNQIPNSLRVSVGTENENKKFLEELRNVL